jgi:hypothetical protein
MVDKSHVEHPVGFVYNQHFQLGKIDAMTSDMVKKPARAGNHNIGTLQFLNLRIDSHATVNSNAS